ncbi:Cation/H+ exchanger - like 10 [Theobroma cacao]|nr:Cation/H+ exchanger - like 10 [Theobroma cacao]
MRVCTKFYNSSKINVQNGNINASFAIANLRQPNGIPRTLSLPFTVLRWLRVVQVWTHADQVPYTCYAVAATMRDSIINDTWLCHPNNNVRSRGIFLGDSPFNFATPVLFVQLSVSALLTAILQLLLTPLGQSAFFSQMLTGILTGPTFWSGDHPVINMIYPRKSHYVNKTFALFGCMLFLFLVGVKTDLSMVKRTGKKAVIIGVLSFVVPITLNTIVAAIITETIEMGPEVRKSIFFIASFQALTSFHVVVCLLADLNLLNSELGRLATSSSLVSGTCSWCWAIVTMTFMQGPVGRQETVIWMFLSLILLLIVIAYVLRPVMLWIVRRTSDGKSLTEGHILAVFMMILGCSFFSEVIGHHLIIGPMFLGMATPEGPPLGSALVSKLDSYVSSILLPTYFTVSGSNVNIRTAHSETVAIISVMAVCNFIGKLLSTVLPSLYCNMPPLDAFSLGLIMCAQGITDILVLQHAMRLALIDVESYTIMSITMVLTTGIITPLVKFLYKPSKQYLSHKKRTIEHAHPETELRMLACIYSQYQTPSIINLLELSNPTAKSPICFYVVHLLELIGRSAPLLITHRPGRRHPAQLQGSEHMINAFRLYEQGNEGSVVVNLFTAVSPYVTMHDEICSLALEKRVSMVIIPFHKQWSTSTEIEELPKPIRSVNQQILQNAPCSVGILVDRGTLTGTSSMSSKTIYSIGMIFMEGPDDREALAYVMRMGEHPNISITVTRLVDSNKKKKEAGDGGGDTEQDDRIVNDFRIAHVGKKHHVYKEEFVSNSVETVEVIRSMENSYDLLLVGRRHDTESPLFMGLTEWNEFPELGFVGDMLASADSGCEVSVLVVQQQTLPGAGRRNVGISNNSMDQDSCTVVDIPRKYSRVWPSS